MADWVAGDELSATNLNARRGHTSSAKASVVSQSIPDDTLTLIELDTEDWDIEGEFDTGTHLFTATKAGYYLAIGSIRWNGDSSAADFWTIIRSGSVNRGTIEIDRPASGDFVQIASEIIYLGVGWTVGLYGLQKTGGAEPFESASLSIHRLS